MPDVLRSSAAPRPASLLRRLAERWREARRAALIHTLMPEAVGLDQPTPAVVAPRVHAVLELVAHPAIWEFGIPGTMLLVAALIWRAGPAVYWPQQLGQKFLFLLFHPVIVAAVTGIGRATFQRRYDQMAREAYLHARWHAPVEHIERRDA